MVNIDYPVEIIRVSPELSESHDRVLPKVIAEATSLKDLLIMEVDVIMRTGGGYAYARKDKKGNF